MMQMERAVASGFLGTNSSAGTPPIFPVLLRHLLRPASCDTRLAATPTPRVAAPSVTPMSLRPLSCRVASPFSPCQAATPRHRAPKKEPGVNARWTTTGGVSASDLVPRVLHAHRAGSRIRWCWWRPRRRRGPLRASCCPAPSPSPSAV
jgi:hypothetical protein